MNNPMICRPSGAITNFQRYLVEAEMKHEFGTDFHYVLTDYGFTKLVWRFYCSFYDSNKERTDLLRSVSDTFFGVVAVSLFEKVILGLCRLLDPVETGRGKGKKINLTIKTLKNHIDDQTWKRKFEPQLKAVKEQSEFAKNWRDKSIAHTDYSVATGFAPLDPALVKDVSELIESIGKLLLTIYDHYFEGGWSFDYWLTHEDEFNVLHHLFEAKQQRKENFATNLSDLSNGLPVTVPLLDTSDYPDWIQRPTKRY